VRERFTSFRSPLVWSHAHDWRATSCRRAGLHRGADVGTASRRAAIPLPHRPRWGAQRVVFAPSSRAVAARWRRAWALASSRRLAHSAHRSRAWRAEGLGGPEPMGPRPKARRRGGPLRLESGHDACPHCGVAVRGRCLLR
jgi:hypothetical protein